MSIGRLGGEADGEGELGWVLWGGMCNLEIADWRVKKFIKMLRMKKNPIMSSLLLH